MSLRIFSALDDSRIISSYYFMLSLHKIDCVKYFYGEMCFLPLTRSEKTCAFSFPWFETYGEIAISLGSIILGV